MAEGKKIRGEKKLLKKEGKRRRKLLKNGEKRRRKWLKDEKKMKREWLKEEKKRKREEEKRIVEGWREKEKKMIEGWKEEEKRMVEGRIEEEKRIVEGKKRRREEEKGMVWGLIVYSLRVKSLRCLKQISSSFESALGEYKVKLCKIKLLWAPLLSKGGRQTTKILHLSRILLIFSFKPCLDPFKSSLKKVSKNTHFYKSKLFSFPNVVGRMFEISLKFQKFWFKKSLAFEGASDEKMYLGRKIVAACHPSLSLSWWCARNLRTSSC